MNAQYQGVVIGAILMIGGFIRLLNTYRRKKWPSVQGAVKSIEPAFALKSFGGRSGATAAQFLSITYSYAVAGIDYQACQALFPPQLPEGLTGLAQSKSPLKNVMATVHYNPHNPIRSRLYAGSYFSGGFLLLVGTVFIVFSILGAA
jgi:hypothetical protein